MSKLESESGPVRPDAILIPRHYPAQPGDRHLLLKAEFGPVLGCARVHTRHSGVSESLVTAGPHESRYFGVLTSRAGQERYDWTDRGDGVLYGVLVEGANDAE